MQHILLIISGPDRKGVVEQISGWVLTLNGNWQDANLHYIAGNFAGIIELSLPVEQLEPLKHHLDSLNGYQYLIKDVATPQSGSTYQAKLTITGNDRSGIVSEISQAINRASASITGFQSRCRPAPNWGGNIFTAQATVMADSREQLESVRQHLENISNDLMVDIE